MRWEGIPFTPQLLLNRFSFRDVRKHLLQESSGTRLFGQGHLPIKTDTQLDRVTVNAIHSL